MSNRERNVPVQFYMIEEEREILDKKWTNVELKIWEHI